MTTWNHPVRTGVNTGATATSTIGHIISQQVATAAGDSPVASNMVLPAGAEIIDWRVRVVSAASAATSVAGQGVNVRIGRVADDAYYATIKVSGPGDYSVPMTVLNPPANVSANSNLATGTTSAQQVFIDATAVTSVSAVGQLGFRVYARYFVR